MSIINAPKSCGTPDQINLLFQEVVQLNGHMPGHKLYAPERRELGGLILPHTAALVSTIGGAMVDYPEHFTSAPISGEDLCARQASAMRWRSLRQLLLLLAEQANDNYLLTQGQAARDAQAALASATAAPRTDPQRAPRMLALISAYLLVEDYQRAVQQRKAAKRPNAAPPARRRAPRGVERAVIKTRWNEIIQEAFELFHQQHTPSTPPPVQPLRTPCNVHTPASALSTNLKTEGSKSAEDAKELIELYEQRNGPLSPPRPEDSFVHTEEELEQGRTQVHAAASNLPPLKIPAQESAASASQRYPEMGGVLTLLRMGVEDNPGLIPGAVGNPALWRRVSELDRSSGRLIYAGQLLQNGGETKEGLGEACASVYTGH